MAGSCTFVRDGCEGDGVEGKQVPVMTLIVLVLLIYQTKPTEMTFIPGHARGGGATHVLGGESNVQHVLVAPLWPRHLPALAVISSE